MKVFLSYAKSDEKLARRIGDGLRHVGLTVWDYRRDVLPGDLWAEKATKALRGSDAMVVLLTPDGVHSEQVRWEIEYALGSQAFKNRLIPVIIGSPDKIQRNSVPWILWKLQTVTFPAHGNQSKAIQEIAQRLAQAA
jgi:hypothetical protein